MKQILQNSRSLNWIFKSLLIVIIVYVFYKQIILRPNLDNIWLEFKSSLQVSQFKYLILIICLVPFNWILETIKWRTFMLQFTKLSFKTSFKTILAGISLALVTPNRIGEYGGRLVTIPAKDNWFSVMATFVGSVAQNFITLIVGLMGIYFLSDQIPFLQSVDLRSIYVLAVFCIVCALYIFFNVDFLVHVLDLFRIKHLFRRFAKYFGIIRESSQVVLFKMLVISFSRYLIYAGQYYLAAKFFGVDLDPQIIAACIATILLIQSGIPLPPFLSVLARGEISLLVWGIFNINELSILGMTFCIWIINLAIPALIGSVVVLNSNILQSLGYGHREEK